MNLLQVRRSKLEFNRLAISSVVAPMQAILLPDEHAEFSFQSRNILDLEVAVEIGHGEIRMIEDADLCLHPWVDRAGQFDRESLGLEGSKSPRSPGGEKEVEFVIVPRYPLRIVRNG